MRRGTPAFAAGVNVDDELLAIDDYRLPPQTFAERLKAYRPGDEVSLLVARRERLLRLPVTFGEEPAKAYYPRPAAAASPAQEAHRDAWLGAESERRRLTGIGRLPQVLVCRHRGANRGGTTPCGSRRPTSQQPPWSPSLQCSA